MLYAVIKALLSSAIIAAVSEVAKRSPALGAINLSLPLTALLASSGFGSMPPTRKASPFSRNPPSGLCYLPCRCSLLLSWLLRNDVSFWAALALSCFVTVTLYAVMVWSLGGTEF